MPAAIPYAIHAYAKVGIETGVTGPILTAWS